MRYRILTLLIVLLPACSLFAKRLPQPCSLLTAEQLNTYLYTNERQTVKQLISKKNRCEFRSENGFVKIKIEYKPFKDVQTAFMALKKEHADNLATIKKGDKAENEYNVLGTVISAKPDDYYMMGDGSITEGPNVVCFRFLMDNNIVSLTCRGLMKTTVVSALANLYNIALKNAGKPLY